MTIQIGHLYKKRTVRKLDGTIYEMSDDTNGGVIISRGNVVNQERVNELAKIEEDRRNSATAFADPAPAPVGVDVEIRNVAPSKVEALEKKVVAMEDNIATILSLLQKK
jgi:hypothetical protein